MGGFNNPKGLLSPPANLWRGAAGPTSSCCESQVAAPEVQGWWLRPYGQVLRIGRRVMGPPMNLDQVCAVLYGEGWDKDKKSQKSKRNTVSKMCRDKVLDARKEGKKWVIWL